MNEIDSILYAGVLSGGIAFVLQIYAQKNITPAPAAIIFSLEGVFATIAAWFLLDQILGISNVWGCIFILGGVLLSQLLPILKKGEHLMIPRKKILTSYKKEDVIGWAKNDINLFFLQIQGSGIGLLKSGEMIKISFEKLLKLAMNYLDNESSNIVR